MLALEPRGAEARLNRHLPPSAIGCISPSPSPQSPKQASPHPKNSPASQHSPTQGGDSPPASARSLSPIPFTNPSSTPQPSGTPQPSRLHSVGLDAGTGLLLEQLPGCCRSCGRGGGWRGLPCPRSHSRMSPRITVTRHRQGSATSRQDRGRERRCGKSIPSPTSPAPSPSALPGPKFRPFPGCGEKRRQDEGEEGVSQLEQSLRGLLGEQLPS